MKRDHGHLRDRAYVLRMDHDLSITTIAKRLGVPRSTVGGWLQGAGETREFRDCLQCGETFTFESAKKRFCDPLCGRRHRAKRKPAPRTKYHDCLLCGKRFAFRRIDMRFCCKLHAVKHYKVFGALVKA